MAFRKSDGARFLKFSLGKLCRSILTCKTNLLLFTIYSYRRLKMLIFFQIHVTRKALSFLLPKVCIANSSSGPNQFRL